MKIVRLWEVILCSMSVQSCVRVKGIVSVEEYTSVGMEMLIFAVPESTYQHKMHQVSLWSFQTTLSYPGISVWKMMIGTYIVPMTSLDFKSNNLQITIWWIKIHLAGNVVEYIKVAGVPFGISNSIGKLYYFGRRPSSLHNN